MLGRMAGVHRLSCAHMALECLCIATQCEQLGLIQMQMRGLVVAFTCSDARVGAAGSTEYLVPIPRGEAMMTALRGALQNELRVCGNHHWGTVTDLRAMLES